MDLPGSSLFLKTFRFTIRVKLLLVTSVIVTTALVVMITFATQFFREHSETVIQEYNLSLAQLIGRKVEGDLRETAERSRFLAQLLDEPAISDERLQTYAGQLFADDAGCIFVAVGERSGDNLVLRYTWKNPAFDAPAESVQDLRTLITGPGKLTNVYSAALAGTVSVRNISAEAGFPLLALGLPANADGRAGNRVLIILLDSNGLLRTFQETGRTELFDLFMVNETGRILAHSDPAMTAAGTNAGDVPIVATLLGNGSVNGSQKYAYDGVLQRTTNPGTQEYLGSYQHLDFGRLAVVSTVEADRVFEAVYAIRRWNLKLTLIVLLCAFVFVFFFSQTLSRPIRRLVDATREIERGHYHVEIEPVSRDEVGVLTKAFRSMAKGLEEKERVKNTFGKFVNPEIVRRAMEGDLKLGGENKISAVLFSDLRNFTAMSENMPPERVVAVLNDYFTHMVDCIHARFGVVDKFIGDAIMAHWGALLSNGNDTENAVNAALDMREALRHVNENLGVHNGRGPRLQIGMGINTGPVLAGQIGSETRLEYTVIGDTVNLASRIEYLNKHFGTDVLISEYAYRMVEGSFHVVEMPAIRIKGKSRPEVVYAVLGRLEDANCPENLHELRLRYGIDYDPERAMKYMEASSDQFVSETELSHGSRRNGKAVRPGARSP